MGFKTVFSPADLANLSQVLRFNTPLCARQPTIAAAVVISRIIDVPSFFRDINVRVGTCGTVTDTVVMPKVIRKGATAATAILNTGVTIAHADADGTQKSDGGDFVSEALRKLEPGDTLLIEVTGAPTGGSDLDVTANVDMRVDDLVAGPIIIGGSTT